MFARSVKKYSFKEKRLKHKYPLDAAVWELSLWERRKQLPDCIQNVNVTGRIENSSEFAIDRNKRKGGRGHRREIWNQRRVLFKMENIARLFADERSKVWFSFWVVGFCFVLFCLFRATPEAYGKSQPKGLLRAAAASLCQPQQCQPQQCGSELHL